MIKCKWCGMPYELNMRTMSAFCCAKCEHDYLQAQKEEEAEEEARKRDPERWCGSEWVEHLKNHPEDGCKCNWDSLSGKDILELLKFQPEFGVHCKFKTLNVAEWVSLLKNNPEFVEQCSCWMSFKSKDWIELLMRQSKLATYCPKEKWASFSGREITTALICSPSLSSYVVNWDVLTAENWANLLSTRKQFVEYCNLKSIGGWDELGASSFIKLINVFQSQDSLRPMLNVLFLKMLPYILKNSSLEQEIKWSDLTATLELVDWSMFTDDQRVEFATDVDACEFIAVKYGFDPNKLRPWCLWQAMRKWPDRCRVFDAEKYDWSRCSARMWGRIAWDFPGYAKYCDASKVDWGSLNGDEIQYWIYVLGSCPEEAIRCFHDWNKIPEHLWIQLKMRRPAITTFRDKDQQQEKRVSSTSYSSGRRSNGNNILKKYWMPTLAVLLMLSAFDEGGVASFVIGAGLGAFWWRKKRKA